MGVVAPGEKKKNTVAEKEKEGRIRNKEGKTEGQMNERTNKQTN